MEAPADFKVPANLGGGVRNDDDDDDVVKAFKNRVNEVSHQVVKLEQKIHVIEQFYSSNRKKQLVNNLSRDKHKGRHVTTRQNQLDCNAASKRMQDLIRQFGIILNQLTQRKGVCSSLGSVDVNDLGLHDSSKSVNGKPRDFNSIKKRMEAKDDSGYKNVREIYSDVRWILKNAMKYNDERSDAHVTAKILLEKFEQKWLLLLPKIMQEEERREEEAGLKQTYHAQMAKAVSCELYKVDMRLKELRELVLQRCRRMSTLEKRDLGRALTKLSADDLMKALDIVAQENPTFEATAEEVDLNIDAQSESTLRRLKYFTVETLQDQAKKLTNIGGIKNERDGNTPVNTSKALKSNPKRKRESLDARVEPAKNRKRTKKVGSIL